MTILSSGKPLPFLDMNEDDIHSVFRSVICAQENNRAVEDWNPADFARLAGVNRLSRTEMSEDHHWRCSSGKWSPEYCGRVKTSGNKHFKTLARRWWAGDSGEDVDWPRADANTYVQPTEDGFEQEDDDEEFYQVLAIQIDPDDPLTAFSIGADSLICTDLANDVIRASLVCTGGELHLVRFWDINQLGYGRGQQPAFAIDVHQQAGHAQFSQVLSMISAGEPGGHDFAQLLTGGSDGKVCLWDVRKPTAPPLQTYPGRHINDDVISLAIDLPRTRLYGGSDFSGVISCWDLESGAVKARRACPKEEVRAVVLGKRGLVAFAASPRLSADYPRHMQEHGLAAPPMPWLDDTSGAWEWGYPAPEPVPGDPLHPATILPRATFTLKHNAPGVRATCVLGLGEDPAMLLAGTSDGCICLMERQDTPVRNNWALGGQPYPGVPVTALAATDNTVVAGYSNGGLRASPMNTLY